MCDHLKKWVIMVKKVNVLNGKKQDMKSLPLMSATDFCQLTQTKTQVTPVI